MHVYNDVMSMVMSQALLARHLGELPPHLNLLRTGWYLRYRKEKFLKKVEANNQ